MQDHSKTENGRKDCQINNITRDGSKQLAILLKKNTPLEVLNLAYNRIEDDGAVALAEALASYNTNLTTLVVCSNNIASQGLCAIAKAMKLNISFRGVYIWGNNLEEPAYRGHTLLVSCYKDLQRDSEMLSALNECLIRERNWEEQWKFLKEAIEVAVKLPEETTGLTAQISSNLLKRLHKEAVNSKDWKLIRLLYLGGGGPEKYLQGKGGIATGRVSASKIAIEDVISAKFKGKQETLSVLLEEGASVNGLNSNINPLVAAGGKGQVEIAKTLLKHNANPCVKTHGNQPLVHEVVKTAIDQDRTWFHNSAWHHG
ncbi:uncharacterized protein LOC116308241 [Actinia tenebrosa]|uniref:Uncharacterized protein LOC116308241 n=1 Tax=Actinia tenebrosa TaxID=6105 RepID=A0A6P8J488_ACTTE|nr:uncharacterized protein LOC116308241 [Actinia tenebrosa]